MGRPLMSPDGCRIVGTLERLTGVASLDPDTLVRNEHDEIEFTYAGGTDVNWDGQETIERDGQTVFVDEDGEEWLANELVEIPEEDEEDGDAQDPENH